ncbi:MAG: AhpC/TSA family protein [Deltaproteobacteria bacterium]|nr:AhpC/TSA family protein [Candidatus Zymogenaceae bacterium]
MTQKLTAGSAAPDFVFDTPWKKKIKLSDFTGKKTTVLMFLRYVGCPICQMKIAELKNKFDRFQKRGVDLLVVLQSTPANISAMISEKDMPFVIVCDPQERLFTLYGVKPGSIFGYVTPTTIVRAIRATRKGFRHGKYEGNERQLPATFIIDKGRNLKYAYYGKNVADVPKTEKLLAEIDRA